MNREQQVTLLREDVDAWNSWRQSIVDPPLDLRGAQLRGTRLAGANLCRTVLSRADLAGCDLSMCDLRSATLGSADLSEANLDHAILDAAVLDDAVARETNFNRSSLRGCSLDRADLTNAVLQGADLTDASFRDSQLIGADLAETLFRRTTLSGADVTNAALMGTVFAWTDLSEVVGLEACVHIGASSADQKSLACLGDEHEGFLAGMGVPFGSRAAATAPPLSSPMASCFISHASEDLSFARKLRDDLHRNGLRAWLAADELQVGDRLRGSIERSIWQHDYVLLVVSANSIKSSWVAHEVEIVVRKERETNMSSLLPIRLDETCELDGSHWKDSALNDRLMCDFVGWQDENKYRGALKRILERMVKIPPSAP